MRGFSVSDGLSANQDAAVSPQISQGSANSLTDYEVQAVTANMVSVPDSGTPAGKKDHVSLLFKKVKTKNKNKNEK